MKKTKKIISILLMIILMIGSLSFVNATESNDLIISKGVKEGNVVTFTITLPEGGGLNGDANDNGRVDEYKVFEGFNDGEEYNIDAYLIIEYCIQKKTEEDLNVLLADYNLDGTVDSSDVVGMNREKELLKNPIALKGTLAQDSTYEMSKNPDGTYKVQVTIPTDKDGTIGITVKERVFKLSSTVGNKESSSELLNISANATHDLSIKINDGVKQGNKVIFKIDLPENTVLRGDVDLNGKVEAGPTEDDDGNNIPIDKQTGDVVTINRFLISNANNPLTEQQKKAADAYVDGIIDDKDKIAIVGIVNGTTPQLKLIGTLASKSKGTIVRDDNNKFYVEVTIPEDSKEGTIGVTLLKNTFMFDIGKGSSEISSNLFDLSSTTEEFKVIDVVKDPKTENAEKVKVTITVNKELDPTKLPNGWTLSEDGKSIWKVMDKGTSEDLTLVGKDGSTLKYTVTAGDKTTAPGKIPQTGITNTIIVVVAGIAIVGTVIFIRSRKMLK